MEPLYANVDCRPWYEPQNRTHIFDLAHQVLDTQDHKHCASPIQLEIHRCRADWQDQGSIVSQCCQRQSIPVSTSTVDQAWHVAQVQCDSWCLTMAVWAPDRSVNLVDVDWAMHVVGDLARAEVPKENPSQCSLLNNLSTKNILYGSVIEHVQYCLHVAHVETIQVWCHGKKYQTC